ncbi:MAG TPA: glutathione S-transferase N-terminal domain-containing protein [Polyangiaceae bacterium]|jgi:glutathione S-transferase
MVKIYGHPASTCTRKVLMTLAETQTPFEMVVVDFAKGEHKTEEHLRRQPFGRIPALDDDGYALFESRAMCRYLNERAGGKLVPGDMKARGKMEQWISIEMSEFSGHAMKFVYKHVFKREQDAAVLEAATKALETTCAFMDRELAKNQYVAGADFSIADIGFMPYIEYAMGTPAKEIFTKHPHLMSWWGRIGERPTWRKVAGRAG